MFNFRSRFCGPPPLVDKRSRTIKRPVRLLLEVLEDRLVPATYWVDALTDTGTGNQNNGDLRYCINGINGSSDATNTIVWSQGQGLHLNGTIALQSSLPIIQKNVTIRGPGYNVVTVQGNATSQNPYDIFDIASNTTVEIDGFTISGGNYIDGGGIHNSGKLTLNGDVVKSNEGAHGAGIFNASGANLYLQDTEICNNIATGYGGGIANYGSVAFTGVTTNLIDNNNVTGSGGQGGGIYNNAGSITISSPLEITLNAVDGGSGLGGGVYNVGQLGNPSAGSFDVSSGGEVTFSKNAAARGGGLYNTSGEATLTNTTFTNNSVSQYGGAMYLDSRSSTTFDNTLVQGNSLAPGGTAGPGVLYEQGATFPSGNDFTGLTDSDDPGGTSVKK